MDGVTKALSAERRVEMARSIRNLVDDYFCDIERKLEDILDCVMDKENYTREDIAQKLRDCIEEVCG